MSTEKECHIIMRQLYNLFKDSRIDYHISEAGNEGDAVTMKFKHSRMRFRVRACRDFRTGDWSLSSDIGSMETMRGSYYSGYRTGQEILDAFYTIDKAFETGLLIDKGMILEIKLKDRDEEPLMGGLFEKYVLKK